jgi:hypothetical protein
VSDNAHQKIVIALPAKPKGPELLEEKAREVWDYWCSLASRSLQAYLAQRA